MTLLAYGATNAPPAMGGAEGPRDVLAALLVDVMPEKTQLLRRDWSLDQGKLPDVDKVSSGELPRSALTTLGESWIEIVNPRMLPGLKRVDITAAGDPVYQLRYSCRIFVWTLGNDWDEAMGRRDRTAAAVRMALLEFPTLARAGGDTGWLVLEETWSEEFGVPTPSSNQSGRCWCSAGLSVDVRAEQQMSAGRIRAPLGVMQTALIGVGTIGATDPIPADLPTPPGWSAVPPDSTP